MSKVLKRASSGKDKIKRRRESESEDSEKLMEELEAASKLKELKKNLRKREGKKQMPNHAIERKIQEQDAKNAARLKELYMNSNALYIIFPWFCFVHQTADSSPPPPAPAADPSIPGLESRLCPDRYQPV